LGGDGLRLCSSPLADHNCMRTQIASVIVIATLSVPVICGAQTAPPAQPNTNPQTKPGGTIVVNPTEEQCKGGWSPGVRWTKEQFEAFCTQLRASK
jgi:hypothetical protein